MVLFRSKDKVRRRRELSRLIIWGLRAELIVIIDNDNQRSCVRVCVCVCVCVCIFEADKLITHSI